MARSVFVADPSLANLPLEDPSFAVPSLADPSLADPSLADPPLADLIVQFRVEGWLVEGAAQFVSPASAGWL